MIIELKNNLAGARIDSMGAQLISFTDGDSTEYIWQRDPSVWGNCSPLLFPIVGNCRDNRTVIDGITCEIPKHGFCKTTEFRVVSRTDEQAVFEFDHTALPEGSYPWHFTFQAVYSLSGKTLTMTLRVINRDSREIFYCIGTHPGFRCPLWEGEKFEDYALVFGSEESHGYRRYDTGRLEFDRSTELPFPGDGRTIPLNRSLFASDAIWFDRPVSREVSLLNPATGKGVKLSFDSYSSVAFWTSTSEDASYVCLEPWNGSAICSDEDDEFLHKNGLQRLPAGETKAYDLVIELL